jgi:ribose transport system permease protein
MTFCAVIAGVLSVNLGLPLWIGIPGALLTGAGVGAFSGSLIAFLRIPPFIVTLGFMRALYGLNLVVTDAKPIYFDDQPNYTLLSPDSSISLLIPGLGIPNAVIIMVLVALLAGVILNKTILGRFVFALGSNEEAVRLSGVNVNLWKIAIYSLSGMICGIAGLLSSSRLGSAQPAIGAGYELDAIAAAVIGGTSLTGGRGTILGTVIGAFIISVLSNGLTVLSVADQWKFVATGAILVTAVFVDMILKKRS